MTKSIPILATALLMTTVTTPVFAQAAIPGPSAGSRFGPYADVLGGRPAYRPFRSSIRNTLLLP